METYTGTIANINNKYVILNDKCHIKENKLLHSSLPYDSVEYKVNGDKIEILKIIKREPQILLGIVKSIENKKVTIFFPDLPKFFSVEVEIQKNLNLYSVVMVMIGLDFVNILHVYDSIKNRQNDRKMFVEFYEKQSKLCCIKPEYQKSICYYTEDYRDLTHLYTFNVDPTESKDFDDAISIDESDSKIYVHIVDANEQINPLCDIDINSLKHAFTLYLPEEVRNILPANLAEDKLSLIEGQERKTITVEFNINRETQEIISHSIYKSLIKIKKRYDYNEFNNCLDSFPFLLSFYNKWKRQTLNIPHLKINVDKSNGKLIDYKLEDYFDDAHKIIETMMILTNLTISKHVGTLIPQRFHSKIKSEAILSTFTNNDVINSIISIKKFKPAIYDATNSGHFGLGLTTYTHFTSPIRRYFDVIIHRLLGGTVYTNIEEILNHINKQEIYIDKLTKCYNNLKLLTYFEENLNKIWKGYVLSIVNNGLSVILEENLYELFIFESAIKTNKKIDLYHEVNIKIYNVNWFNLTVKAIVV